MPDKKPDAPVESILEEETLTMVENMRKKRAQDMINEEDAKGMKIGGMGEVCPHRPDGVRGGGKALTGMKFTGVK